jgi:hypothetical protein
MPLISLWTIIILSASLNGPIAKAQQVSPCITAFTSTGPEAYRRREGSDRCEGLLEQQVAISGAGPELVSLTFGAIEYGIEHDVLLLQSPASNLRLRGQGVPSGVKYRLDAHLPAVGTVFRLPLRDVLHRANILASQLGLLAIKEMPDASPPLFLPLRVGITSPFRADDRPPIMVLRAQDTIF